MYPLSRLDHNFTYRGPSEDIGDLSCRVTDNETRSHWRPEPEEMALLIAGGCVELSILGHPIPPVSVTVVAADQPEVEASFKRPGRPQG